MADDNLLIKRGLGRIIYISYPFVHQSLCQFTPFFCQVEDAGKKAEEMAAAAEAAKVVAEEKKCVFSLIFCTLYRVFSSNPSKHIWFGTVSGNRLFHHK